MSRRPNHRCLSFSLHPAARGVALCGVALSAAVGCSHQPPEFAWSHAASGEYLFAFDLRECGERTRNQLLQAGDSAEAARRSESLSGCMNQRGYFLVDPTTGLALTDRAPPRVAPHGPQARR